MSPPKVSVMMSVYNALPYLPEAMDSILCQTFTDFEFLVLDDGSTDHSLKVIQDYEDRHSHVRAIKNKHNRGISFCRNRLMQEARGEYFAWMDADDIADRERLHRQVNFLDENPDLGVLGTGMTLLGGQKKVSQPLLQDRSIKSCLLLGPEISDPTAMMRARVIRENNLSYDVDCRSGMDYLFWTDACPFVKMGNLPMSLHYYRIHDGQNTTVHKKHRHATRVRVVQKHLSRFGIKAQSEVIRRLLWPRDFPCNSLGEVLAVGKLVRSACSIKPFYEYEQGVTLSVKKKMWRKYIRVWKRWVISQVSPTPPGLCR